MSLKINKKSINKKFITKKSIEKEFFDCKRSILLCVQGKSFLFSVEMLGRVSSYMKEMFNEVFIVPEVRKIILPNVNVEAFEVFRDWLFDISNDKVYSVDVILLAVAFAEQYIVDDFKERCYCILRNQTLSLQSALLILDTGTIRQDDELKAVFPYVLKKALPLQKVWDLVQIQKCCRIFEALKYELRESDFLITMCKSAISEVYRLFTEYDNLLTEQYEALRNEIQKIELEISYYEELKKVMPLDFIDERNDIFHEQRIKNRQNKEKLKKLKG